MPAAKEKSSSAGPVIYVVSGPEVFLKQEAIQTVVRRVMGNADRSLSLSEYDGTLAGVALADVLDDARTLPFLAEKRLVMVRDADSFITRYRAELEEYLDDPSPYGVLLLECKSFSAATRLHKRAQAVGEIIKCEAIKPRMLPAWLADRARKAHGVQIDSRAAALLQDLVGNDLGGLDGELEKLALYVGDRKRIAVADVEALVGQHREEKVWDILSAIAAGNQARAISLWEEVWQTDRAAPGRAVAGVAYTVRRMLAAKRAQESGTSIPEIARMLMRWNDEAGVRSELAAFSTQQLEQMLCRLLKADVDAKSGGPSVQSSIEAFIIEGCRNRRQKRATG
ncbi:MAG: DNA polymerase III subunit delta [Phycisphaerae bacterium]|nr:DNA polymerase III subunit delta [Phycisphaerae bacterium]